MTLLLLAIIAGVLADRLVIAATRHRPVSARAIRRHGWSRCPLCEGAGNVQCIGCDGSGALNDITMKP